MYCKAIKKIDFLISILIYVKIKCISQFDLARISLRDSIKAKISGTIFFNKSKIKKIIIQTTNLFIIQIIILYNSGVKQTAVDTLKYHFQSSVNESKIYRNISIKYKQRRTYGVENTAIQLKAFEVELELTE